MTTADAAAKAALRQRIRADRARRSAEDRAAAGDALRDVVLAFPELASATVVGAYVDADGEPPTAQLLAALLADGTRQVLLPVQRADAELDWAEYDGDAALARGPHGIREPTGPRLGVNAIAQAAVIVVPALAVDAIGNRLGQGGGGYDRALRRVGAQSLTVALLYDEELVDAVPTEPHDVALRAASTPSGTVRFDPA